MLFFFLFIKNFLQQLVNYFRICLSFCFLHNLAYKKADKLCFSSSIIFKLPWIFIDCFQYDIIYCRFICYLHQLFFFNYNLRRFAGLGNFFKNSFCNFAADDIVLYQFKQSGKIFLRNRRLFYIFIFRVQKPQ